MAGPFGIEVELAGIVTPRLESGLARLAEPPDWLTAVEDPRRLRADLERALPELRSGALRLSPPSSSAPGWRAGAGRPSAA